jgi:hypothetical protein
MLLCKIEVQRPHEASNRRGPFVPVSASHVPGSFNKLTSIQRRIALRLVPWAWRLLTSQLAKAHDGSRQMMRFACMTLAVAVLAIGPAACKKAHHAGNDSMSIGRSGIISANEPSGMTSKARLPAAVPGGVSR